jgi:hypothetical protein
MKSTFLFVSGESLGEKDKIAVQLLKYMRSTREAAAKDRNEAVAEQSAVTTQNNAAEAEMNLLSPGRGVRAPSGVNVTAEMQNILGAMPQPTSSRHIRSEAVACARNPAQPEDQRQQQNRLIRNAALAANLGTHLEENRRPDQRPRLTDHVAVMGGMHQSFSDTTKSLTDVLKSLVSTKENTKVEQLGKALSQALNQKKQLQDMGMDTTALDNAIAAIQDKYTAALNDLANSA